MPQISFFTPIDQLTLFEEDGQLISLDWGWVPDSESTPLLQEAKAQLLAYFDGKLKVFDLPLDPMGTTFQKSVWTEMQNIPYGETRTYGDLAQALGTSARPVGGACGLNPLPIIIPCHRVLAQGRKPGGYSGYGGLATKYRLLKLEGVPNLNSRHYINA